MYVPYTKKNCLFELQIKLASYIFLSAKSGNTVSHHAPENPDHITKVRNGGTEVCVQIWN